MPGEHHHDSTAHSVCLSEKITKQNYITAMDEDEEEEATKKNMLYMFRMNKHKRMLANALANEYICLYCTRAYD